MIHSTLTSKGQTTIPMAVRQKMQLKPGDRLEYSIHDDHVTIRVHPGAMSVHGALASDKGRGMTFSQIRAAAADRRVKERRR